jgi:hypothetical protein
LSHIPQEGLLYPKLTMTSQQFHNMRLIILYVFISGMAIARNSIQHEKTTNKILKICRFEGNTKMDLKEIVCEGVDLLFPVL